MAKSVKHYFKNGKVWKGNYHKMPNGELHTNKTHTKTSKPLFHFSELSNSVQRQVKG